MNEMPRPPKPETSPHVSGREEAKPRRARFGGLFVLVVLLLAGLIALGAWTHWTRDQRAAQVQQQQTDFEPTVRTTLAKTEDQPVPLTLPGTTLAFDQASI